MCSSDLCGRYVSPDDAAIERHFHFGRRDQQLGVIGVDPNRHRLGVGTQLLKSFCDLSARDRLSGGVYLETAKASNVGFYERAGFAETGRGSLGPATLWCMYLPHGPR